MKSLLNTPPDHSPNTQLTIDGLQVPGRSGELLIDLLNRRTAVNAQKPVPQVCYLPQMGPIQSCDTCMVKVSAAAGQPAELVRACATRVVAGMTVETSGEAVDIAQREAFDRILENHMLYCTVCDNNNQNCTIHNTTRELDVKHQSRPYTPKPYQQDHSNPFYRYDPDQCILCGRCVEACQSVQVNETLTINWESDHPRVLWGWR
jgi:formate dehydrogenase major subunit